MSKINDEAIKQSHARLVNHIRSLQATDNSNAVRADINPLEELRKLHKMNKELKALKIHSNALENYNASVDDLTRITKNFLGEMSSNDLAGMVRPTPKIILPPGHRLTALAELMLSPEKYEIVCESSLADWHKEYFDALDKDRGKLKMASIRIRHTAGFLGALGAEVFLKVIGQIVSRMKGTGGD